jgi:hypothetical protein
MSFKNTVEDIHFFFKKCRCTWLYGKYKSFIQQQLIDISKRNPQVGFGIKVADLAIIARGAIIKMERELFFINPSAKIIKGHYKVWKNECKAALNVAKQTIQQRRSVH